MTEMDFDHCQVVRESLSGEREVDEQSFASLAILTERLERLKKHGKAFSNVTFSSAVKKLATQKSPMAVG